jgi:Serine/Threonine/Tyrosine Kinase found in polyvalent proteins
MLLKDELKSIISGTGFVTKGTAIKAVANYLRKSKAAGAITKEKEPVKEQEAAAILEYARLNDFFFSNVNKDRYLAEGAEQKVYLEADGSHVIKLNDAIFYLKWEDYFNSLLLHNYFFPATSYELIGFQNESERLYAVVRQSYIHTTEPTDESLVKELMAANNFENKKDNDYFNREAGLILEDLHDENVLTNNGVLFFVDTVFYLTDDFYK